MEVATGALGTLIPKLGQLLQDEYNLQKGAKKNIEFLSKELERIRAALCNVGEVPVEQLNELVRIWSRDVRELSYDMEDIVDTFMVRVQGPDTPSKKSAKRFIKKLGNIVTKAKTRHEIAEEIKDIKERVREVAERRDRYKVDAIKPVKTLVDPRITALYTKTTDLVGIDEAREELITRLTKGDGMSAQQQRVVSIVGFGGLGKTTLAKAVYDQLRVQFDCTAFVSVSQNPDLNKLLKNLLYELDKEKHANIHSTMLEERHLIDLIREFLQNKRYLIVIDDIWDMKPWGILQCSLHDNGLKSIIITTTRILDVAEQIGGCYKQKPLTHESSKKLFYGRIFGSEGTCPGQYFEVSEKILKKCGGVPLAIITTSSLLANKSGNIKEWNDVCGSIGSGLARNPSMDGMRKILLLSYHDLPAHLKACLLYLSIFPEDYEIDKERLIWKWIAEDFVHREEESQSLFELGESYFNELLNRSLIQVADKNSDDTIWFCRVHDMVLELICSLSREESFVTTVLGDSRQSMPSSGSMVRRLSLQSTTWPKMEMSKLRSVTIFSPAIINTMPSLSCCHLLRVLDLEGCNLKEHSSSLRFIGNLFHLRFLSLAVTGYAGELPVEIAKLQFLQTLRLYDTQIEELPSGIVGLTQLMCLSVAGRTSHLPNGLLRYLPSLEMLGVVRVDSACIAGELGLLTQLRALAVDLTHDKEGIWDENMCTALVGSLGKLHKIQYLAVDSEDMAANLEAGSVESLGNLSYLRIGTATSLPTWIRPALLLSSLDITVVQVRREDIQVLGRLQALRYLDLTVAGDIIQVLERFMVSPDAFPSAIRCTFNGFTMVPSTFPPGAMPRLENFRFGIPLEDFSRGEFTTDDLALGHLPSLQDVEANLIYGAEKVNQEVVTEVKDKLRREADVHPNHPSLRYYLYEI